MTPQTKINKLIKNCIESLKKIEITLSGDDSGLENTWEEICVQQQHGASFYWDVYLDVIRKTIEEEMQNMSIKVNDIPVEIFYQYTVNSKDEDDYDDDFIRYIVGQLLYEAESFSNENVNQFVY